MIATGSGTVTLSPPGGLYEEGVFVMLTATSASNYRFDNWSGDLSGSTNPITIQMDRNMQVTANFSEVCIEENHIKSLCPGNKYFFEYQIINSNSLLTEEILGDTTINNKEYSIILKKWHGEEWQQREELRYERVDSLAIYNFIPAYNEEWLIIHFSWNKGDTIPERFNNLYCRYNDYVVTLRDSTEIFNQLYERIEIEDRDFGPILSTRVFTFLSNFGVVYDYSFRGGGVLNLAELKGAIINGEVFGTVD